MKGCPGLGYGNVDGGPLGQWNLKADGQN